MLIARTWQAGIETRAVCSPWKGEVVGEADRSSRDQLDHATAKAVLAFPLWSDAPVWRC